MYFLTPLRNYYEGDCASALDQSVPQRPTRDHTPSLDAAGVFLAWIAPDPVALADARAVAAIDGVDKLQFDNLFTHENSIRDLRTQVNALAVAAGKPAPFTAGQAAQITRAQFRDSEIARWKFLNP